MKAKRKPTKKQQIIAWLEKAKPGTFAQQFTTYNEEGNNADCHQSHFSTVRQAWLKTKNSDQESAQPKAKKVERIRSVDEMAKMQDEIAFLRWWNLAERCGYIDRLLAALEKGQRA